MKRFTIYLLMLLPFLAVAQDEELSPDLSIDNSKYSDLTLFVGLSAYEGDLHCFEDENLGIFTNAKFAFGVRYNRHFNKNFAASLSYINTKLVGDDNKFTALSGHPQRAFTFTNVIHEVSLRTDYTPFGKRDWKVQPFIFGGLGFAIGGADTKFNNPSDTPVTNALIEDDMMNGKKSSFAMPLGFGVKAQVSDKITVGLEAGLRFFANDYLDGVSKSANEEVNDYYGMGGVTVAYRL